MEHKLTINIIFTYIHVSHLLKLQSTVYIYTKHYITQTLKMVLGLNTENCRQEVTK